MLLLLLLQHLWLLLQRGLQRHLLGVCLPIVDSGKALAEVDVLHTAMGAGDHLGVVGEEVEPLVGVDHQLAAVVAL